MALLHQEKYRLEGKFDTLAMVLDDDPTQCQYLTIQLSCIDDLTVIDKELVKLYNIMKG